MTSRFRSSPPEVKKAKREEQKRSILRVFHRSARSMFIGEVSLWVGLHLDLTTSLLDEMVADKLLRRPTDEEVAKKGSMYANQYLLVGPVSAKIAGDDV